MQGTAYLQIIDGVGVGTVREIDKPLLVIGRNLDCDLCIKNLDASRNHARIICEQDEFLLEDTHSTNGTFLNGEPISSQQRLVEGDRIRVSDTIFEFHRTRGAQAPSPAAAAAPEVSVADESGDDKLIVLSQLGAPLERVANRRSTTLGNELKALLQVSQSLRKSLVLNEVLEAILDALFSIFPAAERGFILMEDEDGVLSPRSAKFRADSPRGSIQISRSIVTKVMKSRRATLSADTARDNRCGPKGDADDNSRRSLMCAP